MNTSLTIALIADTYPPQCSSGAVQIRDLSREFVRQGHELIVILPASDLEVSWQMEKINDVFVLRLKAPRTKDIDYIRRTIGEFLMPFAMSRHLRKSPLSNKKWDGVLWYSPSIFHGPFVNYLKKESNCKGYLIIRDIFPEWAVDMGLMGRNIPYRFFDAVARYQYAVADVIGVQTAGNLKYFKAWGQHPDRKLEVLQNWLDKPAQIPCSIRLDQTVLAGRKVFVYAGNMGVAQGMDILIDLAERLHSREDVGFLFVGRGSDAQRLKNVALAKNLRNVIFHDEIHPDQIPDLYDQCHVGLIALDSRHKSHNIPGKFLTYMQSGLPVLAIVNAGNDLANIIRQERVGAVSESHQLTELDQLVNRLLNQIAVDLELQNRCRILFQREFTVEKTVKQIVAALSAHMDTHHSSC